MLDFMRGKAIHFFGVMAMIAAVLIVPLTAAPSASAAPKYPGVIPCNQFRTYQQFLYFFACSQAGGRTVDLLTFGGDWRPVCVRDKYTAIWDRGGYAGWRIDPYASLCNWKKSDPEHRQPAH